MAVPCVELQGIHRFYGLVHALRGVDLAGLADRYPNQLSGGQQ
jgi:ABC-type sulfate/molybdate transport systems ATPase subunit